MFVKKEKKSKLRVLSLVLGGGIIIFSIISMVIVMVTYNAQFPKIERHDSSVSLGLIYDQLQDQYPRRLVDFDSKGNQLQGYVYGQDSEMGLVVIAHGLGGGADSYLAQIIYFIDQGWQVFAYDATGSYDSEGKSTKGFPQSLVDLDAALTYISSQPQLNGLPLLLFGHSWGGYAVANALHLDYDIKGVVTVSASNSAHEMIVEQGQKIMGAFMVTQHPYLWLYQRMLFGKMASYNATKAINQSDVPVFIIHGVEDEMIAYDGSSIISNFKDLTKPHVKTLSVSDVNRSGHNDLFRSLDSIEYINQLNIKYLELYHQYNENIPYNIKQEFYAPLDSKLAQDINVELMNEIHQFLKECISN